MASTRQLIVEAFRDRLELILIASGYDTDAGQDVFLGESVTFGPDDADQGIAIDVQEDDVSQSMGPIPELSIRLPLDIQALAKATIAQPWVAVEEILGDIKKAVETGSATWVGTLGGELTRGTTQTLERTEGANAVGAAITYEILYTETWGAP